MTRFRPKKFAKHRWNRFTTRVLSAICFVFMLVAMTPCRAFDVFPEFRSLTEAESSRLDDTLLIDSEYQSDVVTYLNPLAWDTDFYRSPSAFDFTLGSLSGQLFLQYSRLKIERRLLTDLLFRFNYFEQRDHDTDQRATILELIKRLNKTFSLSLYGEPSYYKRENDFGVAALVYPSARHEIRIFHTWVDLTRAEHNDRPDSFVTGNEPRSMGIVGRCTGCLGFSREQGQTETGLETTTISRHDEDWLQYFVRIETPTRWLFPLDSYEYQYEFYSGGISTRLAPPTSHDLFINMRFEVSRKIERFLPNSDTSTVNNSGLERQLIESLVSVELPPFSLFGASAVFEPGLGWFHRRWIAVDGAMLEQRNLLPLAWLKFKGRESSDGRSDQIHLGYEATFFSSEGDERLRASGSRNWVVEHRGNLRYEIPFEDNALVSLALTADLDALFGHGGGFFEGGNGQFRVFF